jgi:hypothetical protein
LHVRRHWPGVAALVVGPLRRPMPDSIDKELQEALTEFVGAFEVVFRYDWPYTKIMFGDEAEGATFVEPGLEDESDDWGARGALLQKYRRLVSLMQSRGLEPVFPFPLDRLPNFEKRVW